MRVEKEVYWLWRRYGWILVIGKIFWNVLLDDEFQHFFEFMSDKWSDKILFSFFVFNSYNICTSSPEKLILKVGETFVTKHFMPGICWGWYNESMVKSLGPHLLWLVQKVKIKNKYFSFIFELLRKNNWKMYFA